MDKIYNNILELIGNTPLMKISNLQKVKGTINNDILVKIESFNPSGSIKARASREMILDALDKGLINSDTTIIEPTSGNTGIGLAMVCAFLGLKTIIVMPENMSKERIDLMRAYKAEVVLTPKELGMKGSLAKADELKNKYGNAFIPSQFDNFNNPNAHFKYTSEEIIKQTNGKIDILVCGIGTGGTITGLGRKLKLFNKDIKVIGVEPYDSPLITKGYSGPHDLQGIGANFIPENLDLKVVDEIITVKTEEAYKMCNDLVKYEGVLSGISSGASLHAAFLIAKREENKGKNIVCILPDSGERYLSTGVFDE